MSNNELETQRAELQDYLNSKGINDLLYEILENICVDKPDNPHQYIVEYLAKRFPDKVTVSGVEAVPITAADDEEEDEFEEEDDVGELPQNDAPVVPVTTGSRRRSAVSAESMNPAAIAEKYQKKVYEKSPDQMAKLKEIVSNNFLFQRLDSDQTKTLLEAMFSKDFKAGDKIIEQGAEGDNFYVVFSGEAEVWVKDKDGGPDKMVLTCGAGDSFGELALMYNSPRAATVKAKSDCNLFAVDRITFKFILMDTTIQKRNLYEGFLENAPILATLTKYERMTISDALTAIDFTDGEVIIKQGDPGDSFYIIEQGEVLCTQVPGPGKPPVEIGRCVKGDYFGEIALLTNRPRAATVTAVGNVKVLALERKTFTRVMGPLQDILKRNMQAYNSYMVQKI